jgi:[NiFe] hydrogenase diaphorase moiety large subunit
MTTAVQQGLVTFKTIEPDVGLRASVARSRSDVIHEISTSKLKGRGGAGFPTGIKWNLAAAASGEPKYIVCNADEGEPGTFKDRLILTEIPHLVFEGMTIGAYAVGATQGILYLRAEYTYLRPSLEDVLRKRREAGLLGNRILGTDMCFDIEIRMGAGAYVCGEETALIESLEGHRGEPRNRPPFPVDTGFQGKPTVVNNVETFVCAAAIMGRGAAWFTSMGTEKSSGPKLFSVSGDCAFPGVYEFPLGITVADLLAAVGGTDAKAVQIGGASGHCVPASEFGRAICFEESCGQCTPCREGNSTLLHGIEMLENGRCSMAYLNELCKLGEVMQLSSKCGLGQSSPNAFLSIVKHFREELMGRTHAATR